VLRATDYVRSASNKHLTTIGDLSRGNQNKKTELTDAMAEQIYSEICNVYNLSPKVKKCDDDDDGDEYGTLFRSLTSQLYLLYKHNNA